MPRSNGERKDMVTLAGPSGPIRPGDWVKGGGRTNQEDIGVDRRIQEFFESIASSATEETMSTAIISEDGQYRYKLTRGRDPHRLVFVMLNPSTADASKDDATIRRLTVFAREWGYPGFTVVNLYALRSRDPKALKQHRSPVGPHNYRHVTQAVGKAEMVIAAWGDKVPNQDEANAFSRFFQTGKLFALAFNKSGNPGHPLYLPKVTRPMPYGRST